jgi:catechol 2,3-dioxygenase-like lactoylglutathione lyase family enzyme
VSGAEKEEDVRIAAAVPVFRVASVAVSAKWYGDVLGFSADEVGPPDDPVFAILRRGGVELMLQKLLHGLSAPRGAGAGKGWDVYVRVADARGLRERVAAKTPAGPLVSQPYGCLEFEVADPDGHVVVLGECG